MYAVLAPLQGPTVTSAGLDITVNGAPVVLRTQAPLFWRVVQLQPQQRLHVISLVSTTAGFFNQPQDCRVSIAAIVPPPTVSALPCIASILSVLQVVVVLLPSWQH
jgi:hypothetical protein